MSGYPIRRDIVLRGDSASLIHQQNFRRRLEFLFDVHVSVSSVKNQRPATSKLLFKDRCEGGELVVEGEEENGWVTVRGKSEEDCLKTQTYVLASSNPECRVLVPCGPQLLRLLFQDGHVLRDALEKECEVLVTPAPADVGLYVQGTKSSVTQAYSRIHSLADTIPAAGSTHTLELPMHDVHRAHMATNQFTAPSSSSNHDPDPQKQLLFRDPTTTSFPSYTTSAVTNAKIPYMQSPHQFKEKEPDMRSQKLIAQYVKLGFPAEQVQSVVESLGSNASENDIMSRLVKINSARPSSSSLLSERVQMMPMKEGLRPIVIDGSNVAMKHGNGKIFSCKGIEIAVNYFLGRGHSEITIFVPQWRKEPPRADTPPIKDQDILFRLEEAGYVKFTPSRRFGNKKIVCYDDRFIVQLANDRGGIIVSSDNFRDLFEENPSWRETIEKRVLSFVFVEDDFMVPHDPLGKHGPHLDAFLRFEGGRSPTKEPTNSDQPIPKDKTPCPYKEKCTFGPRCRYYHPEREQKAREKELQEDKKDTRAVSPHSNPPDSWMRMEKMDVSRSEDINLRMSHLSLQSSPQRSYYTHTMTPDEQRPGGLQQQQQQQQNMRYTYPLSGPMGLQESSPMMPPQERNNPIPFPPHGPHDQWSGRGREEHYLPGTMARGTDRLMDQRGEVGGYRHNFPDSHLKMTPVTSPYMEFPHSSFSHPHSHVPHSRPHTVPQLLSPHMHPEYPHSHYAAIHHGLHGSESAPIPCKSYTPNIPLHSGMGYNAGYTHPCYKDPREFDQLQSLDSKQSQVYEKAVEKFPQYRDRILALIIQFHISDLNTLIKVLSK